MIDAKTVHRYLDMFVDLMLLRRLQPWHSNVGKRLVKSPKLYVRDSGLVHALLGISTLEALLSHPVLGNSWKGFAIETLLHAAPLNSNRGFYRTSNGAGVDLLLEIPGAGVWAIEVKRGANSKPRRGFYSACDDLQPAQRWLVHSGNERYPLGEGVQAIGLRELALALQKYQHWSRRPLTTFTLGGQFQHGACTHRVWQSHPCGSRVPATSGLWL